MFTSCTNRKCPKTLIVLCERLNGSSFFGMSTKRHGVFQLCLLTPVALWWSFWILLLPLLEEENILHQYFPPREYGLAIPATILIVGVSFLMCAAGCVMVTGRNVFAFLLPQDRFSGPR